MNGIQKAIKIGAICFAVFIISSIISSVLFALSFIPGIKNDSQIMDFTESYNNIHNVDIDISAAKLYIKEGNEFNVEATNITEEFTSKLNNDTLKIKEVKRFFNRNKTATITIYIPKNYLLDELIIDSGAGLVEIENTLANIFDVNQGAGKLVIKNSDFNITKIDGGVGEINISNSILNDLKLQAGVGKININSEITGSSYIESGIGEVELLLKNEEDYGLQITKGIGTIYINGKKQSNDTVHGNGNNKIKIDSGIGEIKINFKR